jgi:flagellar biosynthesis protein FlhB
VKLALIGALTFSTMKDVLSDPIFTSSVSVTRFGQFLAASSLKIALRVLLAVGVIAAADYAYQFWRTHRDLMMTRDEVKDEMKSTEGNPQIKMGRRRMLGRSKRRMLADVPAADVVVTNPTHIAVALRYDRKSMQAPRLVAKGIRKNAEQIREIARQAGVPIIENKPLARLMFKYGKVGREIPAQLYAAVAEILAYVYRTNPYRYYAEACQLMAETRGSQGQRSPGAGVTS